MFIQFPLIRFLIVTLLFTIGLIGTEALAQTSQGPYGPSSNGLYYTQWTNPTNAYVGGNDVYATAIAKASTSPKNHSWENYGFTIPSGSTIQGIEVSVEHKVSSVSGPPSATVNLYKTSSSGWVTAKSLTMSVTESVETLGSSSDTWGAGTAWTAADFNNGNVSVWISYSVAGTTNRTISVDGIGVKVYYTPPAGYPYAIDGMTGVTAVDGMTISASSKVDGL